ncbi:hypothetical protein NX059_008606 [Plenodomus lindquistii]|nr:hypothetical protein NX059_008606 [Plenodomus lindquistii]
MLNTAKETHDNSGIQFDGLSACPVEAGVPIEAAEILPINQDDASGVPDLALLILDFDGQAILRIFSNFTEAEIGCFAARITNGNTFQQKEVVSFVLGVFTLLSVLSFFATTFWDENALVMRKHYAHSRSVSVVFVVWQQIFYSGSLSMNWLSILVAFWSNHA